MIARGASTHGSLSDDQRRLGPMLEASLTAGDGSSDQKSWHLMRPVTLIGSSPYAHVRLDERDAEPLGAALLNTADAIVLTDLMSRRPVACNGQIARMRILQPGDALRLGTVPLRLDYIPERIGPGGPAEPSLELPHPVILRDTTGGPGQWLATGVGTLIGGLPGCGIRLNGEVLGLRALLTRVGEQVVVASLAPDQPVRVNGTPASAAILRDADVLTIGPMSLQVRIRGRQAGAIHSL